jgi:hypothetical protein
MTVEYQASKDPAALRLLAASLPESPHRNWVAQALLRASDDIGFSVPSLVETAPHWSESLYRLADQVSRSARNSAYEELPIVVLNHLDRRYVTLTGSPVVYDVQAGKSLRHKVNFSSGVMVNLTRLFVGLAPRGPAPG